MQHNRKIILQYLVPQHALSRLAGILADCRWTWWKNWVIKRFIRKTHADLSIAQLKNVEDYPNFNSFFTRLLNPELRPIVQGAGQIASPVDGVISQLGLIHQGSLFQAKGFHYSLAALLGNAEETSTFYHGSFITFYLAPKDYHRVHMPFTGSLYKTIYIPGKLFSVNQETTAHVPNLFTRNERLVCFFQTAIGPMVVILVGAMLVGNIQTAWPAPFNFKKVDSMSYPHPILIERGAELGHFRMGSTVIVLFSENAVNWEKALQENQIMQMGQLIGTKID